MKFDQGIAEEPAEAGSFHENRARVIWALAWPAVALNSLQVVNTLLDRGFIGRLPPAALTAQGGSINVMFLMFSLAMSLGTAATALVSRSFGAREIADYRMASKQVLSLTALVCTVLGFLCFIGAPYAARAVLPSTDVDAIRLMGGFLSIYGLGLPAIGVIQTLAGSMRGVGDTKSPMVISGIQILLHITLNFLLIFPTRTINGITIPGANMGLLGASTALSISAWVSAMIYITYSNSTPLGNQWRLLFPSREWTRRILKIAVPSATMAILRVASLTVFTLILAGTPSASRAIAAMSTGFGIESIMFMPAFGLSAAAAALVGQSLGMKKPDRAEALAWTAGHHGAMVTGALVSIIFFSAPYISTVLIPGQPQTAAEAATLIRCLCATEVLFAYAMVMIGALQGAGDTVAPMWISIIAMWGLRVPLALLLALPAGFHITGGVALPAGLGLGALGAWYAMSFTQGVQGVMALAVFKRGAWKLKQV
jgi:putative MATE family efflux protein